MAQNVTIAGASYTDVTAIEVPKTTSGVASFHDVTDTTATADDVAEGKYFYTAAGVKTEGTATIGGAVESDVNFYDYDGTLVKSYTAADFANVTAMPDNPSHDGLTAQGWNWSLSDAKYYVASYGKLDVGQMFCATTVADAPTKIYIELYGERLSPYLGITISGDCIIDWGDQSATETIHGESTSTVSYFQHTFPAPGKYTITLATQSASMGVSGDGTSSHGSMLLRPSSITTSNYLKTGYLSSIKAVELGSGFDYILAYGFACCYCLNNVILHDNGPTIIEPYAFNNCYSLSVINIPEGITSISDHVFMNCNTLNSIVLPNEVTDINNYTFYRCRSLTTISIPNSVVSIGNYAFSDCTAMKSIIIPEAVTTIQQYAFNNCCSLKSVIMSDGVSTMGQSVFSYCYSLEFIRLSNSLTSIPNNAFYGCYALTTIDIPASVTTIEQGAFKGCYSLTNIVIPASVTAISSQAFYNCEQLNSIHFLSSTPPVLSRSWGSDIAYHVNSHTCKIYIPAGSLATYTSATNYPSPNDGWTYIEEQPYVYLITHNGYALNPDDLADWIDAGKMIKVYLGENDPDYGLPNANIDGYSFVFDYTGLGITSSEVRTGAMYHEYDIIDVPSLGDMTGYISSSLNGGNLEINVTFYLV